MDTISRRRFHRMLGCSLLTAAGMPSWTQTEEKQRPNVIILFADDMGYGDLGCYGHPTIRTPNLDRMAREGMRLTSFYATAPVCTPSRAALLTGRYPLRAGQPGNLGPDSVRGLPLTEITLAQLLKANGYRTQAIGKWHLGHDPVEYMPTSRGFDSFFGLPYSNDMIPPWVETGKPLQLFRDTAPIEHPVNQDTLTTRYTEEAVRFIRSAKQQPFFIYLAHSMPHLPIHTTEEFRGKSRAGLYGDVIETLDWSVGQILRTLREEGLEENTLVVFASDNGPWLNLPDRMLQGDVRPWHSGFKGLLRGAKAETYEGGMRVPFIARWPGRVAADRTSAEVACTMDLFATTARLAGAPLPADRVIDGMDISSLLFEGGESPRREFFYLNKENLEAVREGPWKLRWSRHARTDLGPTDPLTPELFQLDEDPAEQYNRAKEEPEVVSRLKERMIRMAEETKATLEFVK